MYFILVGLLADTGLPLSDITLESAEGTNFWKKAWEKNLSEQNIFNAIVGWPIKAALRMWGWFTLDILLYGGRSLFNW